MDRNNCTKTLPSHSFTSIDKGATKGAALGEKDGLQQTNGNTNADNTFIQQSTANVPGKNIGITWHYLVSLTQIVLAFDPNKSLYPTTTENRIGGRDRVLTIINYN